MTTIGMSGRSRLLVLLVFSLALGAGLAEAAPALDLAPPPNSVPTPNPATASETPTVKKLSAAQLQGGTFMDVRMGGQFGLSEFAASGFRIDFDFGYQFEGGLGLVGHASLGLFPGGAYEDFRALEDYLDTNEDRSADYVEVQAGLRKSWLFNKERVRATVQAAYGYAGDVLVGHGHGLSFLGQFDFRVYANPKSEGSVWLGVSAGTSFAFLEHAQVNSANLALAVQVHL